MNTNHDELLIRVVEDLSAVKADTHLLRKELLGNGQPGRMAIAEQAIKDLQERRSIRVGVLYSIGVGGSAIMTAFLHYGNIIWHFFFPVSHH